MSARRRVDGEPPFSRRLSFSKEDEEKVPVAYYLTPSNTIVGIPFLWQTIAAQGLNSDFLAVGGNSWDEIIELCYIPVFGGGFGLSYQEAKGLPVSERRRMLEWLKVRHEEEMKKFKSDSGNFKAGSKTGYEMPRISKPRIPRT